MLSLIVQFPGERPKASQYTSSSLDDCDLILRGFRGVPYGFALSSQTFQVSFSINRIARA